MNKSRLSGVSSSGIGLGLDQSQNKQRRYLYKKVRQFKDKSIKKKTGKISNLSEGIQLQNINEVDIRQQSGGREAFQKYIFVNDKLLPECDEPEFVEVINEYNEVVYLQRHPIQLENHLIQSGFIFLSSPCLHWGEIITVREVYVIDGSGSIICKDLKSNIKEDFCISKGENIVLLPGCIVELRKNSDTELLKLFIVYM